MKVKQIHALHWSINSTTWAVVLSSLLGVSAILPSHAAPVFALPDPTGTHAGFAVNLAPLGPGPLPAGGALGPLLFPDVIPSPDVGHWELEFFNPNPFPVTFDLTLSFPGGLFFSGLTLAPLGAMYFDVGYLDAPPEISPPLWSLSALAAPGAPLGGGIMIDTDAIEAPGPTHPPGVFAAVPGGAGAALVAPTGLPGVTVTLVAIPEPTSFALVGLGIVALLRCVSRRRRHIA
jgi:hypothetical protein